MRDYRTCIMKSRMALRLVLLSLAASAVLLSRVQAQEDEKRFVVRSSVSVFWNNGWENRFFFGPPYDSLKGPDDYMRTLRNTMAGNPEVWWRVAASRQVTVYVTLNYQHFSLSLRDSASMWVWDLGAPQRHLNQEHKALEARLDFFSIGGRLLLHSLPLEPYVGQNIGYCRGTLTTIGLLKRSDNNRLLRYMLVDGSGGGFFFDLLIGAQQKLWRDFSVFIEGGYRFTPVWHNFEASSWYGIIDPRQASFYALQDRHLKIQGLYLALGLQVRL